MAKEFKCWSEKETVISLKVCEAMSVYNSQIVVVFIVSTVNVNKISKLQCSSPLLFDYLSGI